MNVPWPTKCLCDVAEFRNGLWKGKKPPYTTARVIRNTNFRRDGTLDNSDIALLDVETKQLEKRRLQRGDLILEKSGGGPKQPVGRVIAFEKADGVYSFSNFTSMIRILDDNELDYRFLHKVLLWYYESGKTEHMQRRSTGIRNLVFSEYKQLHIPVPPLPEQKRIVAVLDEAFEAIERADECLARAIRESAALATVRVDEVFATPPEHWIHCTVGDVMHFKHGFAFKSEWFADAGDRVLLTPGNYFESGGYRDRGEKQKYYIGEVPGGFTLAAGDLVLAMTEQAPGLLGAPLIVPENGIFLHNQRLGLAQPKAPCSWHAPFFFHFFNTSAFRAGVYRDASGVKVRHTSPKKMATLPITFPESVAEQEDWANRLYEIREACGCLAKGLREKQARLTALRHALLNAAFSGTLRSEAPHTPREVAVA